MASANGHGPKRAVLYARVSTEEQAKSGYSLAQQIEALRAHAAREGYEVLEEVVDPGQSGASLERPGMDRVRDLVAAGGVSAVLAQDRDRISREPAYHYLLRKEFEEHGTKLRSFNDQGDDSPEGELTDGVLDQFAKYQRAKIVEQSRRGKLQKAREGKILAGRIPNYGFKYNATRDGYEIDEETMLVVRRIFRMVGVEGITMHGVTRTFEAEGVRSPSGRKHWYTRVVRRLILDDVYKPHTFDEISGSVTPEVAARLDPRRLYGIWWFNRRRTSSTPICEMGPNGKTYRKRSRVAYKNRDEWIAVPVLDSGIPREWIDAAREVVANHRPSSKLGGRFWELSGAIMRCGECGRAMEAVDRYYKTKTGKKGVICYYRCREGNRRKDTCQNNKSVRSDRAHSAVWEFVSSYLKDPEQLRDDLNTMIEQKRAEHRGDPGKQAKLWAEKLAEADCKRARYQEMAAADLITFDELRSRLVEIEEMRATAERELEALRSHDEYLKELAQDRDALLNSLEDVAPDALDSLTPEERHQLYKMIRLKVISPSEGPLEVSGAFAPSQKLGTLELTQM